MKRDSVQRQYERSDPLKVRIDTHRLYSEVQVDLDARCAQQLEFQGDEVILDIGCGPGRSLLYLREHEHTGRLVGFDQSQAMIDEALASASSAGYEIEGMVGNTEDLPFESDFFDRVVARHMLYHVPHILAALRKMKRVLRPNGRLLITTNSAHSLPRIYALLDKMLDVHGFENLPMKEDARFCIENAHEFFEAADLEMEEVSISNALIFHDPEPIVAYCVSILPSLNIPQDPQLFATLTGWLHAEATRQLADLGGVWRDPKDMAIYLH